MTDRLNSFTDKALSMIRSIPYGKVATYGQIALMSGDPHKARLVSWILARSSQKENLPWHRVINAGGKISLPGEAGKLQRALLEAENIEFSPAGQVSFEKYGWRG